MITCSNLIRGLCPLRMPAIARLMPLLLFAMLLTGCAGMLAYREGNALVAQGRVDEGLKQLSEAVRQEPRNVEYRLTLTNLRNSVLASALATAEQSRRAGRFSEAEAAYRQALKYDPANTMAEQVLSALETERRHQGEVAEATARFEKGDSASRAEALAKLKHVLAENPRHKSALTLKSRIAQAMGSAPMPENELSETFRKPISLAFRDAPVRAVFDVISSVTGINFFFDPDVRPDLKTTILARDVSINDALRVILVTGQLEQKVLNGNSVLIYPNTPQKIKDYQTLLVRTFYVTNADVKAVANTLKTIVRIRDMVVDERLGLIIARDTPEAIRMAEKIVALQDLSDPEVMLDVEIIEVKRSRMVELGIQWPAQMSLAPLQTAGVPLTLNQLSNINSTTTQATVSSLLINANKQIQDGTLLANPRIRVRNKEKAKVLIGDRVPVITTTSTSTGFVAESVNYLDVGLKLEVEPNVHLNEEVAIKINLEVSSLTKEVTSKSGTLAYQVGTRGASTILRLKDGETQVLAGLISDEDRTLANRIPGLGDLPIVGRLFGSQKDDGQRSEILLSITPRILRSIRPQDLSVAEFESGTDSSAGAPSLRLTSAVADVTDAEVNVAPDVPAVPQSATQPGTVPP
jgi:general secretion pathway protein D